MHVWEVSAEGKNDEEIARAGVEALAAFIKEIGLPTTLQELGVDKTVDLRKIADSCATISNGYKKMTQEEIFQIFQECVSQNKIA